MYKQGTRDVAYYYPYSTLIQDKITINSLENQIKKTQKEDIQQTIEIRNYLKNLNLMISKNNRDKALSSIGPMLGIKNERRDDIFFLDSINVNEKIFNLS